MLERIDDWVEIMNITHKDGSPLEEDNWRRKRIGSMTQCHLIGGFRRMTPFFKGDFRMRNGEVCDANPNSYGNASTSNHWPVEVEPGIFDFESNTCIYRFRLLTSEEVERIEAVIKKLAEIEENMKRMERFSPDDSMTVS